MLSNIVWIFTVLEWYASSGVPSVKSFTNGNAMFSLQTRIEVD
uniref:Uncharacterized protein n=1 Tax=Rhizobium rhizogenes TaxID=359 RepID=A0A7S5DR19_RHIRH|nr:hypothetical protein pC6.5b_330 [Rhizobium rhizogenes]